MRRSSLAEALIRAELIHERAVLEAAIARIGREVDLALDGDAAVFLPIMQGGLVFAGQLATAIKAPLEFDYAHATRYRGATEGGQLDWIRRPQLPLDAREV
ncbi:MAG: hypoxanthine-guanine phosphoribosyltransferase, partial [Rhodanobacteraceae bacterium]